MDTGDHGASTGEDNEDIQFSPPHPVSGDNDMRLDGGRGATNDENEGGFIRDDAGSQPENEAGGVRREEEEEAVTARVIPSSLARYWEEKMLDTLKTFPIGSEKIVKGVCMTPTADDCRRMYARSKCMKLLHESDPALLSNPTETLPMCFMEESGSEIPLQIQKAFFFFASLLNHATELTHFVAKSETVDVIHGKDDPRAIKRLESTGLGLGEERQHLASQLSQDGFININDILTDRDLDQSGGLHIPVDPVSLFLGFVGVVFREGGKEKREVFCVLTVTPAENFDLEGYIQGKFLVRPKQGCQKYEQLLELYNEASSFWEEIQKYEIYENLGVDERRFRPSGKYKLMPGGGLGTATVFSPLQIPLKIFNKIRKNHPKADLASIKIIGMPQMTFRHTDETTSEWILYMERSINANQERMVRLQEGIRRYDQSKEKASLPPLDLPCIGGWPLEIDDSNFAVTCFGLPPLPLMHSIDTHRIGGRFDQFIANIGEADKALPDFTRAVITAFMINSSPLNERPDLSHFLKDRRIANPLICLREWFGKNSDPFGPLIIANRNATWRAALEENIKILRLNGTDIQEIVRIRQDYLESMHKTLRSMIISGLFRSNTVSQMLEIAKLMDFTSVCTGPPTSIRRVIMAKSGKIPTVRRFDPFYRTWDAYTKVMEDTNKFFHMNAGNLCGMVELLIAQLFFKFAHTNKTWTFFYCTVIFESGNGHFSTHTPDGPLPNRLKVNNVGSDFTKDRATDVWCAMYDVLLIPKKDRYYEALTNMRSTPTVMENIACATAVAGKVINTPQPETNFQCMAMTENRDDQGALIHFGLARGAEGNNVTAFGRVEDPVTKNGVASQKRKITPVCILQISTNRPPKGADDAEKGKTIDAVAAVIQNGMNPPAQKKTKGSFGNSGSESVIPRNQELSDEMKHTVANFLAFSQNIAGLNVALLNNIGAAPIEVSTVSLGTYAWLCFYIKQYAGGMFDGFMVEGFSRAMEGYKSRGVIFSIWIKTISAMGRLQDMDEVVRQLWGDIQYDALPLVAIPGVSCNILYRCLNIGCFAILAVLAADLEIPYISWKSLSRFFGATGPPAEDDPDVTYREEFVILRDYVIRCLDSNRFCPNDDSPFGVHENISCYITNDGTDNTMLPTHKTSLMRIPVSKDKEDGEDITTKVAQRIESKVGRQLVTIMQMGPGFYPYKYALIKLLNEFKPDFRGLRCPREMYFSKKHFQVLGILQLATGMADYDDPDPMACAKTANFKAGPNDIRSNAVGLNLWSALGLVSLMGGTELHSNLTKTVSNKMMEIILSYSPSGFTPGGISPGFDYDLVTTKPIKLYHPAEDRPNHFWRPENAAFVHTGVLTLAPAIGRFLPEDCFALPLPDIAKTLHCDIMEVPGNAYTSTPTLEPDVWYSFHIPHFSDGEYGAMIIHSKEDTVVVSHFNQDRTLKDTHQLDMFDWDDFLRKENMVITPLLKRLGACVSLDAPDDSDTQGVVPGRKILGCLISYPEHEALFNPSTCSYQALITKEMDVSEIFFHDVLTRALVPVGEILYLDADVIQDDRFHIPTGVGRVLYTRLSVPNTDSPVEGKLYVAASYQPMNARGRRESFSTCVTFVVNPWDVQLASEYIGNAKDVVKHLK